MKIKKVWKYLLFSLFVLAVISGMVYQFFSDELINIFLSNPYLNGFIVSVFTIAVIQNLYYTKKLNPEIKWLNYYINHKEKLDNRKLPDILYPIAKLLRDNKEINKPFLTPQTANNLTEMVYTRLISIKDKISFWPGILIFLGLLGTFWGLLISVSSIHEIIKNLNISSTNPETIINVFNELKGNLSTPLKGMGTAFSSSFLGLICALIIAFLNTQLFNAHNHFYNQLENKLSEITKLSGSIVKPEDDIYSAPNKQLFHYFEALFEQMAEGLKNLQNTIGTAEKNNSNLIHNINNLTNELTELTGEAKKQTNMIEKTFKNYKDLTPILNKISKEVDKGIGLDNNTKENIEQIKERLINIKDTFKEEIKLLAKTMQISGNKS